MLVDTILEDPLGDADDSSPEDKGTKDPGPPYCLLLFVGLGVVFFAGGRSCQAEVCLSEGTPTAGSPHVGPECQFKVDFSAVLVFTHNGEPLCLVGQACWHDGKKELPSVSPLVNTSVRSTLVSPMRSGSLGSSA